uniref:Cilia-and flagella-associated protein 96 n=1 Tax=Felis catus TaxID=9685 RepID=A0ABI7X317_FELCA
MERIGLFSEMEYVTVGDKYVSSFNRPFNDAASKNKQMLPGGSKAMSNLQAGYFDPHFVRIFEGEGYVNLNQVRRRHMMEEAKKNLGKAFLPSNGDKKPCGLGTYYGTIGGPVPFFSTQLKPRDKYEVPGKNLYTNPGKKGTGYGYANITIGKQFSHSADFYDAPKLNFKKENEEHHRLVKGTPFKSNLYPREYFDTNPYLFEKALPPIKKTEKKELLAQPFKPSSPGKKALLYLVRFFWAEFCTKQPMAYRVLATGFQHDPILSMSSKASRVLSCFDKLMTVILNWNL